jgi:predicted metalloendopeptidase
MYLGRQSDGEGNLVEWWSAPTLATYSDRTRCFLEQYSKYRIPHITPPLYVRTTLHHPIANVLPNDAHKGEN